MDQTSTTPSIPAGGTSLFQQASRLYFFFLAGEEQATGNGDSMDPLMVLLIEAGRLATLGTPLYPEPLEIQLVSTLELFPLESSAQAIQESCFLLQTQALSIPEAQFCYILASILLSLDQSIESVDNRDELAERIYSLFKAAPLARDSSIFEDLSEALAATPRDSYELLSTALSSASSRLLT